MAKNLTVKKDVECMACLACVDACSRAFYKEFDPAKSCIEPLNLSFFSVTGWGIGLDYCDIEWFALETNSDHSVVFDIASKYCISDSFVDHDDYSISP